MAGAFEQQLTTAKSNELSFDERSGLLIQNEILECQRASKVDQGSTDLFLI
jgi:hypothetical protein